MTPNHRPPSTTRTGCQSQGGAWDVVIWMLHDMSMRADWPDWPDWQIFPLLGLPDREWLITCEAIELRPKEVPPPFSASPPAAMRPLGAPAGASIHLPRRAQRLKTSRKSPSFQLSRLPPPNQVLHHGRLCDADATRSLRKEEAPEGGGYCGWRRRPMVGLYTHTCYLPCRFSFK